MKDSNQDPCVYKFISYLHASSKDVFDWHKRLGAFERLQPPWTQVKIIKRIGSDIQNGTCLELLIQLGYLKVHQTVEHFGYIEGEQFCDRQLKGPFRLWEHQHRMEALDQQTTLMEDIITYALPWPLTFLSVWLNKELNRAFKYRHAILQHALSLYKGEKQMKILISGASGLVGSALVPFLQTEGHEVIKLVRKRENIATDEISWDPEKGILQAKELEGFDAVIHLAGENIGSGRWTHSKKQKILDSRLISTRLLSKALADLEYPPKVFICASAVGYYGNRSQQLMTEHHSQGYGFLADVCSKWEEATQRAAEKGIRVVNLRIGMVLSPKGGGLQKMLTPFNWGLGGKIGTGQQFISWIAIDDLVALIDFVLYNEALRGPINAVSPHPITNQDFTNILGKVLHRPTLFSMPAFAVRWLFGDMADEVLLCSTRAEPKVLENAGFIFAYPQLEPALRHMLGK